MTYSAIGDPELERKIEQQLQRIVEAVTARLPRQEIVALVLGGGYGRGEGGALLTEHGFEPYNDYDLVLVHEAKDASRLEAALADIGREQARFCGIHVDITPLERAGLSALPAALTWFELVQGHHTLLGDPNALTSIGTRTLGQVDPTEWGRLLFNRGCGLLFASWLHSGMHCSVADGETFERFCTRQIAKAWLALGDVWLADRGRYSPQLRKRLEAWQTFGSSVPEWSAHYLAAVELKLRPRLERPRAELIPELAALRTHYGHVLAARHAAPERHLAGLNGTLRAVHPSRWLTSRPWRYPRERLKRALAAELLGSSVERSRTIGTTEQFIKLWERYG